MPDFEFTIDRVKMIKQVRTVTSKAVTEEEAREQIEEDIESGLFQNDSGWTSEDPEYIQHMVTPI